MTTEGHWVNVEVREPQSDGDYWGVFWFVNTAYTGLARYSVADSWGDDGGPFYWWSEPINKPAIPTDVLDAVAAEVDGYRKL